MDDNRPGWCPYKDTCRFVRRDISSVICGGVMSERKDHDRGDKANSFRMCVRTERPIGWKRLLPKWLRMRPTRFQMNEADFEWQRWIMDGLDGKETSELGRKYDMSDCERKVE